VVRTRLPTPRGSASPAGTALPLMLWRSGLVLPGLGRHTRPPRPLCRQLVCRRVHQTVRGDEIRRHCQLTQQRRGISRLSYLNVFAVLQRAEARHKMCVSTALSILGNALWAAVAICKRGLRPLRSKCCALTARRSRNAHRHRGGSACWGCRRRRRAWRGPHHFPKRAPAAAAKRLETRRVPSAA
jgi:hypothetical protein